jgi:hypothetical protein
VPAIPVSAFTTPSLRDLRTFPGALSIDSEKAHLTAQQGGADPAAKPLPSDMKSKTKKKLFAGRRVAARGYRQQEGLVCRPGQLGHP